MVSLKTTKPTIKNKIPEAKLITPEVIMLKSKARRLVTLKLKINVLNEKAIQKKIGNPVEK